MLMLFMKFHGKMSRITSYKLLVFIQRKSWKLINNLKHMIIVYVFVFKSAITILLKKHLILLC